MRRRTASKGVSETSDTIDLFGVPSEDATAQGTEGHRGRMRTRLLEAGPDALADHEMLEMLLFLALPRRDTKPIARELLDGSSAVSGQVVAPHPPPSCARSRVWVTPVSRR